MNSQSNDIPEGFKMTELGLLPVEWKVVRLRDNSHFNTLPSGIRFFTETKKYLSTSSIQGSKIERPECLITYNDRPSRANMQPVMGTVWFAKMIGTVKVYSFTKRNNHEINEYILSTGFCGILCKDDVDSEYMKFIFLSDSFNNVKDSLCSGTTQRAINSENIGSIQIPLPPLSEQKSIAYVLSAIQKAIEAQDKIIAAARELKKSLMRHLFTYGPVPVSEAENVPLKETEIGPVPEQWDVVRLGQITVKTQQIDPRSEPKRSFKYTDVSGVSREQLKIIDSTRYTGETAPLRARKLVKAGDIIFATVRPYLKRVAIIPNELDSNVVSTAFCIIRSNKELAESNYLFYVVTKDDFINRVSEHQRGSSYPAVTDKDILTQLISLPPISKQQEIARMLSSVDKKIEAEENRKAALQALFKTMLHHLMTGKVRVNHLEAEVS